MNAVSVIQKVICYSCRNPWYEYFLKLISSKIVLLTEPFFSFISTLCSCSFKVPICFTNIEWITITSMIMHAQKQSRRRFFFVSYLDFIYSRLLFFRLCCTRTRRWFFTIETGRFTRTNQAKFTLHTFCFIDKG